MTPITLVEAFGNALIVSTGANWQMLFFLMLIIIAVAMIYVRAKASTMMVIVFSMVFLFMILINPVMALFWIILLVSMFVLIMGLRRWSTGA
jgi:hypothetical protein